MKDNRFGLIGLSIPFLFMSGMTIYYTLFNLSAFLQINDDDMLMVYTLKRLPGSDWTAWFNHMVIGCLMMLFMVLLFIRHKGSFANNIGKGLLLASSIGWTTNGVLYFFNLTDDQYIDSVIILTAIVQVSGAIGFMMMALEFENISKNRLSKKLLVLCGVLITVEGIFNLIFVDDYPKILSKISWLIYFSGFGMIGHAIATKPSDYTYQEPEPIQTSDLCE